MSFQQTFQQDLDDVKSAPMPYIGVYIAVASLVCCVAMVADMIHGFARKMYWMPSKYFTINAAFLTLLAIVVKLPTDFSMLMLTPVDSLAKVSGIVFFCTAMGNFIPSLGSMSDKDLLQNIVALGILVITLCGDLIIQFSRVIYIGYLVLFGVFVFFLPFQFVILAFSALAISTTKKELELKYHQLEKLVPGRDDEQNGRSFKFENLRKCIKIYWVMAATGSPIFVISRSVTASAVALICYVGAIYFFFLFSMGFKTKNLMIAAQSDYKWSTLFILVIQTIGIIFGSVAPTLRSLFTAFSFSSKIHVCDYRLTFNVEDYWTTRLKEWKHRPLSLRVRGRTCRKVLQKLRNLFYSYCIMMQVIIVVESKVLRLISSISLKLLLDCFRCIVRLKRMVLIKLRISTVLVGSESRSESEIELEELKKYVLLLEGEVELPQRFLKDIYSSLNQVIRRGTKQQPTKLLKFLLEQPFELNSLTEFDREQVPSLHLDERPQCWSLSLSNLACIAITVPVITKEEKIRLLQAVGEGLLYARLIENGLDAKKILGDVGKAADVLWNGVELNCKWLDQDLTRKSLKGKRNSKEVIESFAENSKKMVMGFKRNTNSNSLVNIAGNWPIQIIIANSMYRISQSLLLLLQESENGNGQYSNDEMVLKRLMSMIADILVACLSNLPRLITSKCYSCKIEKRETSVKEAAHLLGATEDILKFIQNIELPWLAPEDALYMDEWRVFRV